jgi:hypothetical protein
MDLPPQPGRALGRRLGWHGVAPKVDFAACHPATLQPFHAGQAAKAASQTLIAAASAQDKPSVPSTLPSCSG